MSDDTCDDCGTRPSDAYCSSEYCRDCCRKGHGDGCDRVVYGQRDLDRAVAEEREAIVAWFLARRMTFTADEVLACIRERGGKL